MSGLLRNGEVHLDGAYWTAHRAELALRPDDRTVDRLLALLEQACDEAERSRSSIEATIDLAVDPLDLAGARSKSQEMLARLDELGIDEVRCYVNAEPTHAGRMEGLRAFADSIPS